MQHLGDPNSLLQQRFVLVMMMKGLGLICISVLALVNGGSGFTAPLRQRSLVTEKVRTFDKMFTSNGRVETSLQVVTIPTEVWTSFLPPFLGFYKSEYGVSYAYGFATAFTAISVIRRCSSSINPLMSLHAAALIFYGLRLNLFLFVRTCLSSRMKQLQQNIEERALKRGNRFKTRAPFILSCGLLYYGLVAPLLFTSKLTAEIAIPSWANSLLKLLIGVQWFGFGIAAIGDLTKTYVKQSEKDENFLVTSGIFSFLRHPNYSGEIIGWTANNLCGIVAACFLLKNSITVSLLSDFAAMTLGWVGIVGVLLRATTNLEARQKKEYGSNEKYTKWVESSWGGWVLPAKEEPVDEPQIEVTNVQEEFGSGI